MELYDIRTEYRNNPLGLDSNPRFSWKIRSDRRDTVQKYYQIIVSRDGEVVWDSKKRLSDQSVLIEYEGMQLAPFSIYNCEIIVEDNYKNVSKGFCQFETGVLFEDNFAGQWITTEEEPQACKEFIKHLSLDKSRKITYARIYATALGVYEIEVDGVKAGDAVMAPGWTSYHNRVLYQTYDVTDMISADSEVRIILANGWYAGYLNGEGEHHLYGEKTACKAMIYIRYEDGGIEQIVTDETWNSRESYIRSAEIYKGETQYLTQTGEIQELNTTFLEEKYYPQRIESQQSESLKVTKRVNPVKKIITPRNEYVIDFGQNMAGVVEVTLPGLEYITDRATGIKITHGEVLDREGNFYNENYRTATSEDVYIYDEGHVGCRVHPRFTYHGFRYIKVEGVREDLEMDAFVACTIHSDMEQIGHMTTSNDKINRLIKNIEWGQRSNFFDVPTDCPQRDERLGWTGDAMIFSRTGMTFFNSALFFTKWLRDVALESSEETGVPQICPNIVSGSIGTSIWSDCATVIPWNLYTMYGDTGILKNQYSNMKLWVDWIYKCCGDDVLWMNGFQRGDWLALDSDESLHLMSGGTDKNLVANVFYAYSTRIVRDAAQVLGMGKERNKYDKRFKKIVEAIQKEYITETGRVVSETQTACVLLLYFNLVADKQRERVVEVLEENIKKHKNTLTTGFVGTAYICHVLSENGLHNLAEELLLNEGYPGWLYAVNMGATTIWERWNSILPDGTFDTSGMNSFNHYTYGAIGDWLYRKVAGISPETPGYKNIRIEPMLTRGLVSTDTTLETMYGPVRVATTCDKGEIHIEIDIPANTSANVLLPEYTERIKLGSGHYEYTYATDTNLKIGKYSMNMKIKDIIADASAEAVINEMLPGTIDGPMRSFVIEQSLNDMLVYDANKKDVFENVIRRLNDLDEQQ